MARERTLSEQAFEQFPQALILVDREATVIALNPVAERLTGWDRGDALGRPAADILEVRTETGVNLCAPNGALRRALRVGNQSITHLAYLFRLRTSDDPVRVAYSVSPLHIKGRSPDGAVIVVHDVTPELETIEARDALMLAASHELKTPLTTLKGLSELLLDFDLSEAQRRELLQDLHGQADRMERLIGDILSVSRIDSGRISVDFSRVDVVSVVKHVCDEVRPMLKGRTLKCRIPEGLPAVMGEARKLHQILVNLVNNAIKYSEPGTQITLSARGDPSAVRFEVSDQGVGIRKEHMPRLFEKFYRADDPAVRRIELNKPDLILLDIMLPDVSGFDVCRDIRKAGLRVPIIILSAKTEEIDVVVGLEIGADDYITKPFRTRELLARIAAHLRKARQEEEAVNQGRLEFKELVIDLNERRVFHDSSEVMLTHTEFDLLAFLASNAGKVLSREKILNHVWGYEYPIETRVIDVHIRNLRRKIEQDPSHPFFILAVPGIGYRFTSAGKLG